MPSLENSKFYSLGLLIGMLLLSQLIASLCLLLQPPLQEHASLASCFELLMHSRLLKQQVTASKYRISHAESEPPAGLSATKPSTTTCAIFPPWCIIVLSPLLWPLELIKLLLRRSSI